MMHLKDILGKGLLLVSLVFSMYLVAEEQPNSLERNLEDNIAYFFGFSFGDMLKEGGNASVDLHLLNKGMIDSLAGTGPKLDPTQLRRVIAAINEKREQYQNQKTQMLTEEGQSFLNDNSSKEGVNQTASGLQYKVQREGNGKQPKTTNTVRVHYEGRLINGKVFYSSYAKGEPEEFGMDQVIQGWTEGLQLMKEGGKTTFYIPAALGYGAGGTRDVPPHSVLVFDIELIKVI